MFENAQRSYCGSRNGVMLFDETLRDFNFDCDIVDPTVGVGKPDEEVVGKICRGPGNELRVEFLEEQFGE